MTISRTSPALIAVAIGVAGCGGSSSKTVTQTVAQPTTPTTTAPAATTPSTPSTTPAPKPPTATATTPETPGAQAQTSCGSTAGHFIRSIQTIGADCSTARQVANSWLSQVQHGSNPAKPITVSAYVCAASFRGQLAVALCRSGPSRIVFAAQP